MLETGHSSSTISEQAIFCPLVVLEKPGSFVENPIEVERREPQIILIHALYLAYRRSAQNSRSCRLFLANGRFWGAARMSHPARATRPGARSLRTGQPALSRDDPCMQNRVRQDLFPSGHLRVGNGPISTINDPVRFT